MIEYLLIVYLYTPNPQTLRGFDWTMETKGTYRTEQACREAAKIEQAKDVPSEGGRIVTCKPSR